MKTRKTLLGICLLLASPMGHITKRFFNGDGQNGESCLFIGSYGRRYEMDK